MVSVAYLSLALALACSSLEAQPALARTLGESAHPAVVAVAVAVEDARLDPLGTGAFRQQAPGGSRLLHAREVAQFGLGPYDVSERVTGVVVD